MSDVFVFGSNRQGRHGKGAALHARTHFGAIYGQGVGRQGNSYAIPTKETPYERLSLAEIRFYVNEFLDYAGVHFEESFHVTEIGCGLAGNTPEQIAPMFKFSPPNVNLPESFKKVLNGTKE